MTDVVPQTTTNHIPRSEPSTRYTPKKNRWRGMGLVVAFSLTSYSLGLTVGSVRARCPAGVRKLGNRCDGDPLVDGGQGDKHH
jgi:hypothetical protein